MFHGRPHPGTAVVRDSSLTYARQDWNPYPPALASLDYNLQPLPSENINGHDRVLRQVEQHQLRVLLACNFQDFLFADRSAVAGAQRMTVQRHLAAQDL